MRAGLPVAITMTALLIGCAMEQPPQSTVSSTQGSTVVQSAQVTNVRDITIRGGPSSGIGAIVGTVLGSVAGNTPGGSNGRAAATVGGTVAGDMAGQQVEQSGVSKNITTLTVRFENGDTRTYDIEPGESFRIGDIVKITTSKGITRITH
jgi:outer membrane lipoprotein SlyB